MSEQPATPVHAIARIPRDNWTPTRLLVPQHRAANSPMPFQPKSGQKQRHKCGCKLLTYPVALPPTPTAAIPFVQDYRLLLPPLALP